MKLYVPNQFFFIYIYIYIYIKCLCTGSEFPSFLASNIEYIHVNGLQDVYNVIFWARLFLLNIFLYPLPFFCKVSMPNEAVRDILKIF